LLTQKAEVLKREAEWQRANTAQEVYKKTDVTREAAGETIWL